MIRTILAMLGLIAAVLWLPLWVQLILFCVAVLLVRYRLALFVPAVLADVLYAPQPNIIYCKMTVLVGVLIILWWVVMTKTRIGERYA